MPNQSQLMVLNDLIFDIGLHLGEDTAFYLRQGYRVIAIEADPDLAAQCRLRFSNEISSGRLHIIERALAATDDQTIAFLKSESSVWGSINPDWAERNRRLGVNHRQIEARTIRLMSILKRFGVPLYLKMDIEGGELEALTSLLGERDLSQYLSIKSEKVGFKKLIKELLLLRKLGYQRFKIVQQCTIPGSTLRCHDMRGVSFAYTFENHSSGPFGDDAPGQWVGIVRAVISYAAVFVGYRIFGDDGLVHRHHRIRFLRKVAESWKGHSYPGWYDTHAAR